MEWTHPGSCGAGGVDDKFKGVSGCRIRRFCVCGVRLSFMHSVREIGIHLRDLEADSTPDSYYYRARYYDQTAGRFLNEDPMGFNSNVDFYGYVRNNPISLIDPSGMQSLGNGPADPNKNTIVCNGRGGIRPHIGDHGKLPPGADCIEPCMIAHEEIHIGFVLGVNPTVCYGVIDGIKVIPWNKKVGAEGEIPATIVEIVCLQNLKGKIEKKPCPSCTVEMLDWRINQMRN
jgi:RHS repeat-associated protein